MAFLPIHKNGKKVYASFWYRALSFFIDFLIFSLFLFPMGYLARKSIFHAHLNLFLVAPALWIYVVYFNYRFGGTLGKLFVGIRITKPDGRKIGIKEAFLRSSVDLGFSILSVSAYLIAYSKADPNLYLTLLYSEKYPYLKSFIPNWWSNTEIVQDIWILSEFVVLLFNKYKRALHDYIAGTVVIYKDHRTWID